MSTLKVNEIEDYSGNTVTIRDNTVIEGAGDAAKNLTVTGTSALEGAVTCSSSLSATAVTVGTTVSSATVSASSVISAPAVVATSSLSSNGTISSSGNCTIGGTLTVGGLTLVQYLKGFGAYNVADPTADVASLTTLAGGLNLATGSYDYDQANNKLTFTVAFTQQLSQTYFVIPTISTSYAANYTTSVLNVAATGFDVQVLYTSGTDPTSSQFFNLSLAVLAL